MPLMTDLPRTRSFNTEDGIGRATTAKTEDEIIHTTRVSIPKTVSGGLQPKEDVMKKLNVSNFAVAKLLIYS